MTSALSSNHTKERNKLFKHSEEKLENSNNKQKPNKEAQKSISIKTNTEATRNI